MDIVLDTNILFNDLKFKDKNYEIIWDYLVKTNSKILIPQIVFEEITEKYRKRLNEREGAYKTSIRRLNDTLTNTSITTNEKPFSMEDEVRRYQRFLKMK